jgi:predicted DNA binding CopG/RHH family protein
MVVYNERKKFRGRASWGCSAYTCEQDRPIKLNRSGPHGDRHHHNNKKKSMARRTRGTRRPLTVEEQVWRDFKSIMRTGGFDSLKELAQFAATHDSTEVDFLPEIDLDDLVLDGPLPEDLVGSEKALTTSPEPKPIVMEPVSGTRSITIRVPAWVLRDFKAQAEKTGVRYQRLINRALADETKRFPISCSAK